MTYCFFNTLPSLALADEFDTLQLNASVNNTWDNNIFRRSSEESSDQITTYVAGVKLDKTYSLQRFLVNVNYVDNKYQTNNFLDFDTVNYEAQWQWSLTPSLTGTISSSRSKSLAGFADFRNFAQNIRTVEVNRFRVEYSPHKVWALVAGLTETQKSNSQVFNAIAGYDSQSFDYGARYFFPSGSTASLIAHKRNSDVQRDLLVGSLLDNKYSEDELELDIVVKSLGKSSLSASLGYINREHAHFSSRDYKTWFGHVTYDLLVTGKIKANIELDRKVGAFETAYSTYSVTDSGALSLNYYLSDKFILGLNTRLAQRDFKQSVFSDNLNRTDYEKSFGATLTWQPLRNLGVLVNSTKSSRNASNGYNQFDYDDVTTGVTLDLKI